MTPPSNGAMVIARPFTEVCYPVQPGHTYNGSTSFSLMLRFSNTNGTHTDRRVLFNPDTDSSVSWQYAACQAVADQPYSSITVYIEYGYNENTAYFDGIQLFKEMFGSSYEDGASVATQYDNDGNIGIVKDSAGNSTKYYYDALNRLMRYDESGSGYSNSAQWRYDEKNNLSSQTQNISGTVYTTGYTYDNDNRLTSSSQGGIATGYTYAADGTGRLTQILTKNGTANVVTTSISAVLLSVMSTTALTRWCAKTIRRQARRGRTPTMPAATSRPSRSTPTPPVHWAPSFPP